MKPILFNTEMVRAIMGDRKTVTRRVVKFTKGWNPNWSGYIPDGPVLYGSNNIPAVKSPYRLGDILYVRETWSVWECEKCRAGIPSLGGDCTCEYVYRTDYGKTEDDSFPPSMFRWHPSIHMPREAARIFLRVTDVRVERLQECGKGWCLDIEKEGIVTPQDPILYINDNAFHEALRKEFQKVWDSTVKPADRAIYGWDANPWV